MRHTRLFQAIVVIGCTMAGLRCGPEGETATPSYGETVDSPNGHGVDGGGPDSGTDGGDAGADAGWGGDSDAGWDAGWDGGEDAGHDGGWHTTK